MAQQALATIMLPQADGATLTLAKPAATIVTLAPNLAELVFAAGAGQQLVAVVEYSSFPAQVKQLPRVGDAFRIDLERIMQLDPDLVIAWQSGNPPDALQKLEQMGLKVWRIEISHPEQIAMSVEQISIAAGTEEHGRVLARQLHNRLEMLKRANAGKVPVSYFYQVSYRPLFTINERHIISRGLQLCAANNIFSGLATLAPQISREALVAADPQVMIAPQVLGDPPELEAWQAWPGLQAVKHNALLYLPADEISQATPRMLDSLELACKLLDAVRQSIKE
jgi:iron complex transport system substrate-binding protein